MSQLLDEGKKRTVEAQHAVFGVVYDVGDLARDQPRIDRMPHRAKTGDAVLDLEVTKIVPSKRGDPVARRDAMAAQRIGQFPCAMRRISVGITMDRAFHGARDDLSPGMKAICMLQ